MYKLQDDRRNNSKFKKKQPTNATATKQGYEKVDSEK